MIYLGTTGWDYEFWEGEFYPMKIVKKLPHYSKISAFTELRSTFTSLPTTDKVANWASSTPDSFMFISRLPRDLDSKKEEGIKDYFELMGPLGNKHQMCMIHFSTKHQRDDESFEDMRQLLSTVNRYFSGQILVDASNRSWQVPEVKELLSEHSACLVGSDKKPVPSLMKDPSLFYLRLAGDRRIVPVSSLGVQTLDRSQDIRFWADHLSYLNRRTKSIFVAVDNHFSGNALSDIYLLGEELKRRKLKYEGFTQS
ncbi:MAG: DUF72 domain-containing protein [Candidatus Kariarchaeaceae archaeon]|jgi:uncharacterized protein YecE (DUF72 family)